MSKGNAKNWTSVAVTMTGAYINVLGSVANYGRRGLIIINTSGVDLLINPNATAADATSYTVPAGESFDFADQPPIQHLWAKATSGNILVWQA